MNNRIHTLFKEKPENILSVYFTAGFPNFDDTIKIIKNLEKAGVDMVEVGFPFSDPLADGPVIQQSSQKAIENGMSLNVLFEQLKELRKESSIPVVLMGYLNPVLQYGEKQFIEDCQKVGVDGIIIPDMPVDYYIDQLQGLCEEKNVSNIMLITPETKEQRIKFIDETSNGFIYMVSSNSITGSNKNLNGQTDYFKRIKNMKLKNQTIIGFGIHNNETFNNACKYSAGAIVGSAFIKHLENTSTDFLSIQQFINSIRS
jgi:tryptophan synthase alpha chain